MSEQIGVIRWEDPPPSKGGAGPPVRAGKYDRLAVELIANPGRWALVKVSVGANAAAQAAATIRTGRPRCFAPAGDFDACTRAVDGRYRVYARYLGDNEQDNA